MTTRFQETIRSACQLTLIGCTEHGNGIGPELVEFMDRNGLDADGSWDSLIVPGGIYSLFKDAMSQKQLREELCASISLHQPEMIALVENDACRRAHMAMNWAYTQTLETAAQTIRAWFPQAQIRSFPIVLAYAPHTDETMLACIDWRNSPILRSFASDGCKILTVAGDFERFTDHAPPQDRVLLTDTLTRIGPHNRITLVGHLGCGYRGRTRGFTDHTDETLQYAVLRESGQNVIRQLAPHFPRTAFRLAVSLTRGSKNSEGLDVLSTHAPLLAPLT